VEAGISRIETKPDIATEPARPQRDVGAVVNALHILQCIATTSAPIGVAAVARATGISTSTCFNILRTLTRARFVSFHTHDKTYALGLALAELSIGLIGMSHAELIRPELERIAMNHQTLMLLWRVSDDQHFTLIDRAFSKTAIRVEIGEGYRLPLLAGAIGRCAAAASNMPSADLRRQFANLRWETPPSFAVYADEVAQAKQRGWGFDNENLFRGLVSTAALITDWRGHPRFGISSVSIAGRQSPERTNLLGHDLHELASLLARSLFPQRPPEAAAPRLAVPATP
jgi:DNA-binding IclR family transcriptional regulator